MSDGQGVTPISEADYEQIEAAVMETERGRWFLREFARRNRTADTEMLLAAIERLARAIAWRDAAGEIEASPDPARETAHHQEPDPFAAIDRLSAREKLLLFT
jgi:hypothetical protein